MATTRLSDFNILLKGFAFINGLSYRMRLPWVLDASDSVDSYNFML